jgi:translation initiation factor 2B subunit (eIF-2B alpha/beta/delta family)
MSSYNPDKLIQVIEEDHIHGADWLSNAAIGVLITASLREDADSVDVLNEKLWSIGVRLAATRPSMASLANKIGYLFGELDKVSDLRAYRAKVSEVGTEIINSSRANKKRIAEHLKGIASEAKSVFTYSYSGTVVDVIRENRYKNIVVTESRPMMEGKSLAKELGEDGFNVLMMVDGAVGMYVTAADICLIGADSVQFDGSAVNKVGSKLLGYAARDHGVPFYVLCDTSKFNVLNYLGASIELEAKTPDEVSEPMKNVTIKNPYFEIVPPELITGVITEEGFMEPLDIRQKMESMRKYVEPLYSAKNSGCA